MQKTQNKSGLAIAGLVLGIIGILLSAIPIINNFAAILGILALIFGIVGIIQTKKGIKSGRGIAVATVVLAVVTIIVVIISQILYSRALDEVSDGLDQAATELDESLNKATGDATEELLENDVSIELGAFTATADEYGFITSTLPVTVTNKNSEKQTYSIQIEALDVNGKRIADDYVSANDLGAGQTQDFETFTLVTSDKVDTLKTATFKIVSVSQY